MDSPIEYARLACDTMIKKFKAEDLPPKGIFHYHQGVFLSGMQKCFNLTGERKYFEYVKSWIDSVIDENGQVKCNDEKALDDLQPSILLVDLYNQTKDERYKKVMDRTGYLFKHWTRNKEGGFWHKSEFPDQMWLDGLYMAGPFAVEYGKMTDDSWFFDLVYEQATLMYSHLKNEKTGLLYHGWDAEKIQPWANKETGSASEHWGRAIGWFAVAMLDMLEVIPQDYKNRKEMENIVCELLKSIIQYQDKKSGMWYQVVDKGDREDNWLEGSCSSLFTYSIFKAIRLGLLDEEYKKCADAGLLGVISALKYDENGGVIIDNVCIGTGISDYEYYINRPKGENDLHGMGAFILMCDEAEKFSWRSK